jgi:hypothetical protein
MPSIFKFSPLTIPVAAVSAALLLAGCGGSSNHANQTSVSHTHTASVASASSTSSANQGSTGSSSAQQATTTQTTGAKSSASEAQVAAAREHAFKSYAHCLRAHDINPKARSAPPAQEAVAKKCLAGVEATFKAETGK